MAATPSASARGSTSSSSTSISNCDIAILTESRTEQDEYLLLDLLSRMDRQVNVASARMTPTNASALVKLHRCKVLHISQESAITPDIIQSLCSSLHSSVAHKDSLLQVAAHASRLALVVIDRSDSDRHAPLLLEHGVEHLILIESGSATKPFSDEEKLLWLSEFYSSVLNCKHVGQAYNDACLSYKSVCATLLPVDDDSARSPPNLCASHQQSVFSSHRPGDVTHLKLESTKELDAKGGITKTTIHKVSASATTASTILPLTTAAVNAAAIGMTGAAASVGADKNPLARKQTETATRPLAGASVAAAAKHCIGAIDANKVESAVASLSPVSASRGSGSGSGSGSGTSSNAASATAAATAAPPTATLAAAFHRTSSGATVLPSLSSNRSSASSGAVQAGLGAQPASGAATSPPGASAASSTSASLQRSASLTLPAAAAASPHVQRPLLPVSHHFADVVHCYAHPIIDWQFQPQVAPHSLFAHQVDAESLAVYEACLDSSRAIRLASVCGSTDALEDILSKGCTVFHFTGRVSQKNGADRPALALEDDDLVMTEVDSLSLIQMLQKSCVQLMVLMAPRSLQLGQQVIDACCVSWCIALADDACGEQSIRMYVRQFYLALLHGKTIPDSHEIAKRGVQATHINRAVPLPQFVLIKAKANTLPLPQPLPQPQQRSDQTNKQQATLSQLQAIAPAAVAAAVPLTLFTDRVSAKPLLPVCGSAQQALGPAAVAFAPSPSHSLSPLTSLIDFPSPLLNFAPHALPPLSCSLFLGRHFDCHTGVSSLLADSPKRVLHLTGPSKIGKTQAAIAISGLLARKQQNYEAILWCDLTQLAQSTNATTNNTSLPATNTKNNKSPLAAASNSIQAAFAFASASRSTWNLNSNSTFTSSSASMSPLTSPVHSHPKAHSIGQLASLALETALQHHEATQSAAAKSNQNGKSIATSDSMPTAAVAAAAAHGGTGASPSSPLPATLPAAGATGRDRASSSSSSTDSAAAPPSDSVGFLRSLRSKRYLLVFDQCEVCACEKLNSARCLRSFLSDLLRRAPLCKVILTSTHRLSLLTASGALAPVQSPTAAAGAHGNHSNASGALANAAAHSPPLKLASHECEIALKPLSDADSVELFYHLQPRLLGLSTSQLGNNAGLPWDKANVMEQLKLHPELAAAKGSPHAILAIAQQRGEQPSTFTTSRSPSASSSQSPPALQFRRSQTASLAFPSLLSAPLAAAAAAAAAAGLPSLSGAAAHAAPSGGSHASPLPYALTQQRSRTLAGAGAGAAAGAGVSASQPASSGSVSPFASGSASGSVLPHAAATSPSPSRSHTASGLPYALSPAPAVHQPFASPKSKASTSIGPTTLPQRLTATRAV